MKRASVAWSLVAAVFLGGAVASAQSLTDIAKKEEARRKAVKAPVKVYTNDDLKPYPATPPAQPASDTAKPAPPAGDSQLSPGAPKTDAAKPADTGEQKDEAYWKGLITAAQTKLDRDQSFQDALQVKINSLTNDFYARDDPAQRALIWTQRTKALEEVDRLKKEIADDTAAIAKIREDARRAGVPPGWLR